MQKSVTAAKWIGQGVLDLVFIDGDHSFEAVRDDLDAWWPTLRPGGTLAGHDYAIYSPGVVRAVLKFAAKQQAMLFLGLDVWYMQKPSNSSFIH